MKTKVTKWGNSYAVRIPKQLIDDMQINESELHIERKGESISLRRPSKEAQLRELLKKLEPQEAVDWGPARGKEVW